MHSSERDQRVKLIGILGAVGSIISVYLIQEHYSKEKSLCDVSDVFSCSVVNKSSYSEFLGVPVAVFGLIWCGVLIFGSWKVLQNDRPHHFIASILLWSFLGVLFIVYMVVAEMLLGTICIFCTLVHILTAVIFYQSVKLYADLKVKPSIGTYIHSMRGVLLMIFLICIAPVFLFKALQLSSTATTGHMDQEQLSKLAACMTSNDISMFGSDLCGTCQRQKAAFGDSFKLIKYLDCDSSEDNKQTCSTHDIKGYPTWIKFRPDGSELARVIGFQSPKDLAVFSACESVSVKNLSHSTS